MPLIVTAAAGNEKEKSLYICVSGAYSAGAPGWSLLNVATAPPVLVVVPVATSQTCALPGSAAGNVLVPVALAVGHCRPVSACYKKLLTLSLSSVPKFVAGLF